ncbi:MAG: hypothetical protein JW734_04605 [Candidatus Omnitrophica bacterium]|nr:hypothetical protein [Candidatus Omnitrophota bacterium]
MLRKTILVLSLTLTASCVNMPLFSQCTDCFEETQEEEAIVKQFLFKNKEEELFFKQEEEPEETLTEKELDFPSFEEKILIKKIRLTGAGIITEKEIKDITSAYENKEFSLKQIQKIADSVTEAYHKKGYLLSRAYIPVQNFKEGILQIRVVKKTTTE